MTPIRVLALAVASSAALLAAGTLAADPAAPPLPRSFRSWKHVRSIAVTDPEHGMYGFHDGYANDAAMRGLRTTPRRFEDGATFVVSIYDIVNEKGVTTAGKKRRDVVQVKDRRAKETGGWRFAAYDPAGKPIPVDPASCFSCHAGAADRDHVLTELRE